MWSRNNQVNLFEQTDLPLKNGTVEMASNRVNKWREKVKWDYSKVQLSYVILSFEPENLGKPIEGACQRLTEFSVTIADEATGTQRKLAEFVASTSTNQLMQHQVRLVQSTIKLDDILFGAEASFSFESGWCRREKTQMLKVKLPDWIKHVVQARVAAMKLTKHNITPTMMLSELMEDPRAVSQWAVQFDLTPARVKTLMVSKTTSSEVEE